MEYIEVGQNEQPIGAPILEENLKYVFPNLHVIPENMHQHGYRPILDNKPEITAKQELRRLHFSKEGNNFVWNWDVITHDQAHLTNYCIRFRRDRELRDCDWTQTLDAPLSAEKKIEWAAYRTALRNLTNLYPDVDPATEIEWPVRPNK
jgi:hypothetical protein